MSARQISQAKRSDARAQEAFYLIANVVKHPADLSIDSLSQNNPQTRGTDRNQSRDLRALAVEINSAQ